MDKYIAKWHRELGIFSRIKPLIILEGNILDVYSYPEDGSIQRLPEYLNSYYSDLGYQTIVFFDNMGGFSNTQEPSMVDAFAKITSSEVVEHRIRSEFKGRSSSATELIRKAVGQNRESVVVIMNLASRLIPSPDNMQQNEVDGFTNLLIASLESRDVKASKGILKNLIVMIVNKVNDLPAWFYLDNPNVRTIHISMLSKEERERLIKSENFRSFFAPRIFANDYPYYMEHPDELERIQDRFIGLTEGFSFTEINCLRRLCKNEGIHISRMSSAIDLYRYGIKENPWDSLNVNELRTAKEEFTERVKGQDVAIDKTMDVIKRAVTGMSGLQSSSHAKPKGILFFAGPTGTGKTETAKTLAEKIFGDESRCIRFDMSEYSQSHSDQKLLGAPPGYVGYEAGGQLTNAVKENPFSILLFDEIEKAHPSIFDKFLQILEDGRMTDGQGNTVYFSECIIIFTSNLGIYTRNESGARELNVTEDMEYSVIQTKVRDAIESYFKLELGRPEILNRIGENIVVFDFIRPETAKLILNAQINKIAKNMLSEKQIHLTITETVREILLKKATANLSNGGRGIGNIVESLLINPLSRYLFDENITESVHIIIEGIDADNIPYALTCRTEAL